MSYGDFKLAACVFASLNTSNKAMSIASPPFVMLSKSAKIIPVIMVGTLRGVYQPKALQFVIAFLITIGLVLFNYEKMSKKAAATEKSDDIFGIGMVVLSLAFDGLT